ncbi:peptidoglycan-binding domain-containing protein [uncultured Tateyamaria sp.]|uniref:peptidoglycan-binding domain-containing protein n=1 Tax=uncultured Tateyamaria sp. TaxID=455651 RepID=UPI00262A99D5|nr:peptidoglycan-binding domain-containing protein [uncultured Tateyamaria sp.]
MSTPNEQFRQQALRDAHLRANREAQTARVRERLDLPLAAIVLIGVLALAAAGYFAAQAADRSGWFDPPVLRPLPDARILTNLRDSDAPFVGGAALADGEGPVVLLREDGQMARFDETTGLVSTWEITSQDTKLQSPVTALSAGCNNLQTPGSPCPDPDRLFLLSEGGGLVESGTGRSWTLRLSDAPWVGNDGTPVEQDDVQAWAASANGRYVAVYAGDAGLAIFDQQRDAWRPVAEPGRLQAAAAEGPVHLLAKGAEFWLGTAQGFARLTARPTGAVLDWSDDAALRVRDLDLTTNGDLLALVEAPCATGGAAGCLSIGRVTGLNNVDSLVGEQEKIATLTTTSLRHAVMQNGKLVVVDEAGLFSYDSRQRTWATLVAGRVDAFQVAATDGTITATLANKLVQIKAGRVALQRDVQGGPFTQIEVAEDGLILGLARDGQLRNLRNDTVLAGRDGAIPNGVVFLAGASVGTRVLLLSQRGILIHDVAERRFQWVPAAGLTPEQRPLLDPRVALRAVGEDMWLVDAGLGLVWSVSFQGDFPAITATLSNPAPVGGPVRSFHAEADGLYLVNGEGRPLRVIESGAKPRLESQVGLARSGQGGFTTATAFDRGIVFATPDALWRYDVQNRGWIGPEPPPDGTRLQDITFSNSLVALTTDGRVFAQSAGVWEPLLGAGEVAAFALQDVSDALPAPGGFFVAGQGQVQFYDTGQSRFGTPYTGGRGPVRLVTQVGGRPVWLSDAVLRFGDAEMTSARVVGAWDTGDGILALAQADTGNRFAMHWRTPASAPACTFFGVKAPEGDLIDATLLPDGRILALTTRGAGLYVGEERRWLSVQGIPLNGDMRLYQSDGHVLAIDGSSIRSMPLNAIPTPDSCAAPQIALNWSVRETGLSASYDDQRGQAALLVSGGGVLRWRGGNVTQVLTAADANAPDARSFVQALQLPMGPVFAARDAIWFYNLTRRRWQKVEIDLPGAVVDVAEIDLSFLTSAQARVTVWTQDGRSYLGAWSAGKSSVTLEPFRPRRLAPVQTPPDAIRDISAHNGNWIVSSDEALEVTRIGASDPVARITLPDRVAVAPIPVSFGSVDALLVGGARAPERLFIFPGENSLEARSGDLRRLTYDYSPGTDRAWGIETGGRVLWRIAQDGRLLSCDIRAGASVETCQAVQAAPLELNGADVGLAFDETEGVTWAVVGAQLVQFDPTFRERVTIDGPSPTEASRAMSWGANRLFWDGPGGDLWVLEGRAATRLSRDVQRLVSQSGDLLVETGAGFERFDAATPGAKAVLAQTVPLTAQSFDWLQGRDVTGLDASGYPTNEDGRRYFDLPVPQAARVQTVLRGPRGRIWVQRIDGALRVYEISACEIPPHSATRPCVASITHLHGSDSGLGRMLSVDNSRVHFEQGSLSYSTGGFAPFNGPRPELRSLPDLLDTRAAFVRRIIATPGGVSELAPADIDRAAAAVRDSQEERLAGITVNPNSYRELSTGWLSWNRAVGAFSVASASGGRENIPATQFIKAGRLIMDHPGVARFSDDTGAIDWITPHAIWQFDDARAQPELVQVVDLPEPLGLEEGRVLFPDTRGLALAATTVDTDQDRALFSYGALGVSTQWRAQSVGAEVARVDGSSRDAFAPAVGFGHDQRQGVGWGAAGVSLATPVGIVPASGFDQVLPLPAASQPDHMLRLAGTLYARSGSTWTQFDPGTNTWANAANPTQRREPVSTGQVTWTLDGRQLDIRAADPEQRWRVARDGLNFRADQLIALAASPKAVVVGTPLGTHSRSGAAGLEELGAPDQSSLPAANFDGLAVRPGDPVIFARPNSGPPVIWDIAQKAWIVAPAQRQPWRDRRAVSTPDVQIDLSAGQTPFARHRVGHADGSSRFARFDWRARDKMPFDRARAVHAEGQKLYVGTDMGLRRLFSGSGPALVDLAVPSPRGDVGVQPVTRIGRPSASPERVLARDTAGSCIQISAADQLSPCSDPQVLDSLRVTASALWVWDKTARAVRGVYLRQGQTPLPIISNPAPRWPHDTLTAHGVCRGARVELWSDTQTLRETTTTQTLPASGWEQMQCQDADVPLGQGGLLRSGLYLTNRTGGEALRHTGPSVWSAVAPRFAEAVQAQARGEWAYQAGRFRIKGKGAATDSYEHRRLNDVWYPLPWSRGLPTIDATRGVVVDGTHIDRVTPLGVVRHQRQRSRLFVDPDTLLIPTTDPPDQFGTCVPDRLAQLDGRTHTLPVEPDAPIIIRCGDGRLLTGDPGTNGDVGVFQSTENDVFAKRTAVSEPDGWLLDITDETPGSDPDIRFRFRDNDVTLSAGRFDLDDYRALATPFEDRVSLVAGRGLWEHSVAGLALHDGTRPADIPDPDGVTTAHSDRQQTTRDPLLCVQRGNSGRSVTYTSSGEPAQAESCADWRGADALFEYRQTVADGPSGLGIAANGPVVARRLEQGRFADRIASGLPQPVDRSGSVLFPNAFGAARLNGAGQITDLYSYAEALGVATLTEAGPAVLTRGGVQSIDPNASTPGCGALSEALRQYMPDGVDVTAVTVRPGHAVHLRGRDANGAFLASKLCEADALRLFSDPLNVETRARHISVMRSLPGATSSLVIQQNAAGHIVVGDGAGRELSLEGRISGTLLAVFAGSQPRGSVILTDQEAYLLDVDAALTALSRMPVVTVPSKPTLPTKTAAKTQEPSQAPQPKPTAPDPEPEPTPPPQPKPETVPQPAPTQEPTPAPPPEPRVQIPLPPLSPDGATLDLTRASRANIRAIQDTLRQNGFDPGPSDGLLGTRTRSAIRLFQKSRRESATGRLTPEQYRSLRGQQ